MNVDAPTDAGDARREDVGDHQGQLLLRRARRRGEGQVQDHAHDGRRALVSRRPLGLAVRPGLLVVRRRFVVVSRLVALGHAAADRRWWGITQQPPEVVAEAEVPIRPDGTLAVEIDTALAKAAHPDQDQRYEITAEITDQSRRTIVGTGTVLVARKPFSVYTWVDRGHYRVGDTIEAGISAQTLDHKPVAGKGTLKLLKITYDAERGRSRRSSRAGTWCSTPRGQAQQAIKASAPGQYRLAATIDDGKGHAIEGGYLLTITGQGFDGASFRFNDLEVIPDRKEYRPGENAPALDQHQSGQFHGPSLRSADEWRVPAAEGRPPARQEHGRGDRHRPARHAQYLRRGPDDRGWQGPRRGPRDRHPAGIAGASKSPSSLAERLQAGSEGEGQSQAHRP